MTLSQAARQRIESLQRAGVTHMPKGVLSAAPAEPTSAELTGRSLNEVTRETPPTTDTESVQEVKPAAADNLAELDIIRTEVAACTLCSELANSRTQTVFGVGNPNPRLCFMGEAPGADEDRQGEPFVGAAGQLLNKIIEACKLKREDVYILNTLKCRPPGNRNPAPAEAANCRSFLDRQLAILQPEYICCLGAIAAQNLLGTTLSVGRLRGTFHQHGTAKVICTYHPAYLLRTPSAKKQTWDDMKMLMADMGVKL